MIHRSVRSIAVLLACGAFGIAGAVEVNITGKIDNGYKPVAGAVVYLANAKHITSTTGADGMYLLKGNTPVLFSVHGNSQFINAPFVKQSTVHFSVASNGEAVRIDMYSLSGRHAGTIANTRLNQGNYTITPHVANLANQVCFVKLSIGSQTATLRLPMTGKTISSNGSINRVSETNTLAKEAAAVDTIIVSLKGYVTGTKTLTTYPTTAQNITIFPVASIAWENGSYASAADSAKVIVTNPDATTSTVSVHVWSDTDTKGFNLTLAKDPIVAGVPASFSNTAKMIHFSFLKSDSTKNTLFMKDNDQFYASYYDAVLLQNDTTITMWNGAQGSIGPGMSQYRGLLQKLHIDVSDKDLVGDTVVMAHLKSQKDTVGINIKLYRPKGSDGGFARDITLSFNASIQDSILQVGRNPGPAGDVINMTYQDMCPVGIRSGSACNWFPVNGSIFMDSTVYHTVNSKALISIDDADVTDSILIVKVTSKTGDPTTGINDTLKAIRNNGALTGKFARSLGFNTTASKPNSIKVAASDSVFVKYVDNAPDSTYIQKFQWLAQ